MLLAATLLDSGQNWSGNTPGASPHYNGDTHTVTEDAQEGT
jgi:hypothetical protein